MKPGSLLASHLGERYEVDSYHHQAVKDLGTGLEAVAWAPHGTIEAVEMPGSSVFVLGVQWELHEEWQDDERMLGIWEAFVDDARRRMEDARTSGFPDRVRSGKTLESSRIRARKVVRDDDAPGACALRRDRRRRPRTLHGLAPREGARARR